MRFKEWLEKDEFDLFDESIKDLAKGVYGVGKGLAKTAYGAGTIGDEFLSKLMGDGTKGRMGSGFKSIKSGLGDIFIGSKPTAPTAQATKPTAQATKPTAQASDPWKDLMVSYKKATTRQEKDNIQKKLAMTDPIRYQQALKKAEKLKQLAKKS